MTTVSPTQLCRLYILGIFEASWKSKTATREIIARTAATAFSPAWMDFIRSLLHFQVHGSLYTTTAGERRRRTKCGLVGVFLFISTQGKHCDTPNTPFHETLFSCLLLLLLPRLSRVSSWALLLASPSLPTCEEISGPSGSVLDFSPLHSLRVISFNLSPRCHLHSRGSHIFVSGPELSSELHTHIIQRLSDLSTYVLPKYLKLHTSKIKLWFLYINVLVW